MKKSLMTIIGLMALPTLAMQSNSNSQPAQVQPNTTQANKSQPTFQPKIKFSVYELNNNVPREIGRQYSVSNKNHQLCWAVFNMPLEARNQVSERFQTPSRAKFADPQSRVQSSTDGLTHMIETTLPSAANNEYLLRCWRFDHTDPLGRYSVDIRVNNVQFPTQTFELVK